MVERGKPDLSVGECLFAEDDLIMVSARQHYLFCPRQCALIHLEQQWLENRLTAEGRILHERVHTSGRESRRTLRVEFDVPIRSLRLGLIGRADIVEFHRQEDRTWQPLPVEYKRGRPKRDDSDRVQLLRPGPVSGGDARLHGPAGVLVLRRKAAADPGRFRCRPA